MESLKLNIFHSLPNGFFESEVSDLHRLLGGPSLFHLNQGMGRPVFISTLLHGNEHSGILALKRILKRPLKREVVLFIGNTMAASSNKRHLEEQLDFNRVWSGGSCGLAAVARDLLDYLSKLNLLCAIDIHNNTGKNPFYGCINKLDNQFYNLAQLFSRQIVYFTEPHEVISMALSRQCPSVTIEAGLSGEEMGICLLEEKLTELLKWETISDQANKSEFEIYHTVCRLKFSHGAIIDFKFDDKLASSSFSFRPDMEDLNFKWSKKGDIWGYMNRPAELWLEDPSQQDLFDKYFELIENKLMVKKSFVPAMLTTNQEVIKDDCFGYVMELLKLT